MANNQLSKSLTQPPEVTPEVTEQAPHTVEPPDPSIDMVAHPDAVQRFRELLAGLSSRVLHNHIPIAEAKRLLHRAWHNMSKEDQQLLYVNNTAYLEMQRFVNMLISLQQEIPSLLSQVKQ